jgi:predicted RNase H-like HicB family nuclease
MMTPGHHEALIGSGVAARDRVQRPETGGLAKGATVTGYVVVFEGDDKSGYSAYSPDLPGVVAAAATRQETQALMMEAMGAHLEFLRETGQPVPEPGETAGVVVLDPAAA